MGEEITKVKMLKVGKYSWDGKTLRVFHKDYEYPVIANSDEDKDCLGVHMGVVNQWLTTEEPFCEIIG